MGTAAKPMRAHRTITVDVRNETTAVQLLGDGKALLEWVMAFILSIGFQLKHQATCRGCGLPLPRYFLADEKHRHCLTDKVYLPTIVCGRVIWPLGYTEDASTAAFTEASGAFQRAAFQQEP
jgi:hypothetical protein